MDFSAFQVFLGGIAALLVGISKTGVPGTGILVVPLLAEAFGGRPSVGIMLPMLIFADLFAVGWYKQHTRWDKLIGLFPWVAAGMLVGAYAMMVTGTSARDVLSQIIGILVILMLLLHLLRKFLGDRFTPKSKPGMILTGLGAGFTTMVSNAAGPIMQIYLAAHKTSKEQFVGTLAWYFFIMNVSKLPIYAFLNKVNPQNPIITLHGFSFNLITFPVIFLGVHIGRWLLPRISQKTFETIVLVLAGIAAVKLVAGI